MRRIRIVGDFLKRFRLFCCTCIWLAVSFLLMDTATSSAADKVEKIAIFPATPYEGYIVYESLAVFWLFIVSLLVIIRMKLREIERVQALGADQEDHDAPLLE